MTVIGWLQILTFFAAILAVTRPHGAYMHDVLEGGRHALQRPLGWLEQAPPGPGTLPTSGPLFAGLLVRVILIVGALTFFPALSLGAIVEHFLARSGKVF